MRWTNSSAPTPRCRTIRPFIEEFRYELKHFVGRPSPIYHAARLSRELGGAQIFLKREDLNHTGAHKVNNTDRARRCSRAAWASRA
jgi:tryptophan synthase beta subunit